MKTSMMYAGAKRISLALALGLLTLTSCHTDNELADQIKKSKTDSNKSGSTDNNTKPDNSNNAEDPTNADFRTYKPTDTQAVQEVNKTDVAKIVVKLYLGHLHPPVDAPSFHYAPLKALPEGTPQEMGWSQQMTFEYKDNKWTIANGSQKFFLLEGTKLFAEHNHEGEDHHEGEADDHDHASLPAPDYGCWIEYYNAAGEEVTGEFAGTGAYQTFFIPQNIEAIISGALNSEDATPTNVINYFYKDTEVWNKSAKRQETTFRDATDPIGLKGFFQFPKANRKMNLNLQLYQTKQGKVSNGAASPFYQPSAFIQKTGTLALSLPIPIYVYNQITYYEHNFEDPGMDEEDFPKVVITDLSTEEQLTANYILKLLGTNFNQTFNNFWATRLLDGSDESGGVWF